MKKYKCPKCGCKTFSSTAHVCQDWMLDTHGNFVETIGNCSQVTHRPNDDDLWECLGCGYDAAGSSFAVPENEFQIGALIKTLANALIPNTEGKIVSLADDDYPDTKEHFIVDFGNELGTCTVHQDDMVAVLF